MAKLTVTIKNTAGTLLSSANVTYACGGVSGTVATDSVGVASISGLPAGSYTVTGSIQGYTAKTISVPIGTDDTAVTIELATSVTAAAESAAQAVLTNVDWKTVKAAAEAAVTQLNTSVSTGDLTDSVVVSAVYAQVTTVIQNAVKSVEDYKSKLMISRHTKGFFACLLIDAKLVGITAFQMWLSSEISKLQAKLESKLKIS